MSLNVSLAGGDTDAKAGLTITGGLITPSLSVSGDVNWTAADLIPVFRAACGTLVLTAPASVAANSNINFTAPAAALFRMTAAPSNAGLVATSGGVYQISATVNAPTGKWQITVNGTLVPGGEFTTNGVATSASLTITASVTHGQTIAVHNADTAAASVTSASLTATAYGISP